MAKKNGNGKSKFEVIIYRLGKQDEYNVAVATTAEAHYNCILEKLEKIKEKQNSHDVAVRGVVDQTCSTQAELTEYKKNNPVAKEMAEHKASHWNWFLVFASGTGLTGIIAGIAISIEWFKKKVGG